MDIDQHTDASTTSDQTRKHTHRHTGLTAPSPRSVRAGARRPALSAAECCVAQERLSQSMAGSSGSAWVLDRCPIRRAFAMNCVCLIRTDRVGGIAAQGQAELRGRAVFGQQELMSPLHPYLSLSLSLGDRLDFLLLEA